MTQLTNEERKKLMADMKVFDEQMPCIGIFWYDLKDKSFFGVRKKIDAFPLDRHAFRRIRTTWS